MSDSFDPRVDDYVRDLPQRQIDMCQRLQEVIHAADSGRPSKRKGQPYFVLVGNVCAILAAKDHVNLFTYDGAILPDPDRIITGGHGNSTARTIAFYEGDRVPVKPLTAMLREIIVNNRAGSWRTVKAASAARRNNEG